MISMLLGLFGILYVITIITAIPISWLWSKYCSNKARIWPFMKIIHKIAFSTGVFVTFFIPLWSTWQAGVAVQEITECRAAQRNRLKISKETWRKHQER